MDTIQLTICYVYIRVGATLELTICRTTASHCFNSIQHLQHSGMHCNLPASSSSSKASRCLSIPTAPPCFTSIFRRFKMQTSTLLSLILLICACVAEPEIGTLHILYVRGEHRQNSSPTTKTEISKAQKQVRSFTKDSKTQQNPSQSKLQRQNSAPITKSNINAAKKQVQSSSQDEKNSLVADLVLGHQKDKAEASAAKSFASHRKAIDWHKQVNAHFVTSWKAFEQGNGDAQKKHNQKINWKSAMTAMHRQKAENHANDALEATGIARKMEISGLKFRNEKD